MGQVASGAAAANEKVNYAAESVVHERLSTVYRFAADGTGSREITVVTRIQSDAAARQFGVVTIGFAGGNERVELDYVRARKPDGSVVETPVTDAQEMPQEVTRQAPFYSDLKEKQIPVRNLRVGDTLEYKARIVQTKAEAPGEFWGQESFGYGNSNTVVLEETIELRVPKGKYVKVWSPEHTPVVSEENGEVVYRWKGSQLEPTVTKDGKANTKEIDPEGEFPSVTWTTFRSWENVGAWYRGLEADRIVADADIKAKVAELTAGKTTDEEKVRALYGYVATQVRYIGVAFGVGRYQPHPAGEVLRNQYGDCKDKHTLLASMLAAAGLHPEAVLIGAGIRFNENVPSPAAFNHLITTLPVAGKQVWLDTTAEVAPYGMLVITTRDKQALVVPETGVTKVERTPAAPPFAPFSRFAGTGTLSKEGTMKAHIEYTTRGDDELVMRAMLRQVPPGQWDQFTQVFSQGIGFGGTTSHAEAGRPDVTADPEKLAYDYEREKTGDWDNYKILPLFPPVFITAVDEKNPPKKFPIVLGEPRVETSISTITLPDGWGAEPPKDVHEKAAFATFDKSYKIDHNILTVERRVEILERRVPAADWKAYKKWLDATVSDGETYIQLTSTATKSGEKAPPAPGSNNADAAKLVEEAYAQIQRGEVNAAAKTLDHAEKINDKQAALWSTYGYLEFQRQNWAKAIENYKKEIVLNPNTYWVYGAMANAQMNAGDFDGSLDTMRTLHKLNPSDGTATRRLAAMLSTKAKYDEAAQLLDPLAAASPDDASIRVQLGIAQMESGKAADGAANLLAGLKNASDPPLLNNAAYELAKTGVELETAEKSARKAVELLTTESADWKPDAGSAIQAAKQTLLIASWDTLGWILFQENKLEEADGYIRASWLNRQEAEVGLHLGEIEEKEGHVSRALTTYREAMSSVHLGPNSDMQQVNKIGRELHARAAGLEAKGAKPAVMDARAALQEMRTLPAGKFSGSNGLVQYAFVLSNGKITNLQVESASGATVTDAEDRVQQENMTPWTPPGSEARLMHKGTLNCHTGKCELVIHPM